jgi:hypothetical protein
MFAQQFNTSAQKSTKLDPDVTISFFSSRISEICNRVSSHQLEQHTDYKWYISERFLTACTIIKRDFNYICYRNFSKSRDSSIGIASGYRLVDQGSIPCRGKIFFSTSERPDRLWGPPSLLYNVYWGLTTRLHLHPPIRLNGVVFN